MPQLNETIAEKVNNAEDGFALLDPGVYLLQLVEVTVKEGQKGPYWSWRFDVPEGQKNAGRRFYENTSLSEAAFFRLKSVFAAFEVPTTTNTDDLIGRQVRGVVGHQIIGQGARMGELSNNLESLLPKDGPTGTDDETLKTLGVSPRKIDPAEAPGADTVTGGSTEEPLF
jgi:hypothetical protein